MITTVSSSQERLTELSVGPQVISPKFISAMMAVKLHTGSRYGVLPGSVGPRSRIKLTTPQIEASQVEVQVYKRHSSSLFPIMSSGQEFLVSLGRGW